MVFQDQALHRRHVDHEIVIAMRCLAATEAMAVSERHAQKIIVREHPGRRMHLDDARVVREQQIGQSGPMRAYDDFGVIKQLDLRL